MADDRVAAIIDAFTSAYEHAPDGVWHAPGRVNVIGEHTDYNDGYVLPFALPQGALVAASARGDETIVVRSAQIPGTCEFQLAELDPARRLGNWSDYVVGVVWAMRDAGELLGGLELLLDSNVPIGAGLSSSAAIECSVMAAICDLFEIDLDQLERARLCQRAENLFVGAPTGLLDQAASTMCTAGNALFLDCRSFAAELVPFDLGANDLELLVLDTHTPHAHVDGEYAQRRAECEQAADQLGAAALRDITDVDDAWGKLGDPVLRRRMRHVVSENARVLDVVALASEARLREIGPLLSASHTSMRDDYDITVPTVDLAVMTALDAGALGARMTGGGFGGCIIALCDVDTGLTIGQRIADAFALAGYDAPTWFLADPSAGAGRLS